MEELLVGDFVNQWFWKKLDKDISRDNEKNIRFLIKYLDEFVKRNIDDFNHRNKYMDKDLNKNMIPNYFLLWYGNTMRNTIENKDKIYFSNYLSVADKLFGNIWEYCSSDGKKYLIWEANINWKSYLCAEELGNKTDDVIYCGKIVAEDYLKTIYK
jgi:hypothetical protein